MRGVHTKPQAELTDSQPDTCSKAVRIKDELYRVVNMQSVK